MANCPYCSKYFSKKQAAIDHINKYHGNYLERDGMDAAQALYFSTHGTLKGKCMCGCGQDTEWNYKTGKPYKVSNDPQCRERLRRQAVTNHKKIYGTETLLNDMEHQKEMQKNRPTSGKYKFADGGEVGYLSSLEQNFLQFCDKVMEFTSNMVQESPETFTYKVPNDGKEHQYIPDYYLPDYNLLVEIKDGGENPNTNPAFIKETKYKVALKDEVMRKQNRYNYIKIVDKKYGPFMEILYKISRSETDYKSPGRTIAVITEHALMDVEESLNMNVFDYNSGGYLLVVKPSNSDIVIGVGLSQYPQLTDMAYTDYTLNTIDIVDAQSLMTSNDTQLYKFAEGTDKDLTNVHEVLNQIVNGEFGNVWDILSILAEHEIWFTGINASISNNSHNLMDFILEEESNRYDEVWVSYRDEGRWKRR